MEPDLLQNTICSRFSLLDLPLEIITHVLSYLVPSNAQFNLQSRKIPFAQNGETHDHWKELLRMWGEWQKKAFELTACSVPNHVVPLLLIHPNIYRETRSRLYSSNKFCFPDTETLRYFTTRLSPNTRSMVRSIYVEACGPRRHQRCCQSHQLRWAKDADLSIVAAIQVLPGLRELHLGGVGPGIPRLMALSGTLSATGRMRRRMRREDYTYWALDGIELVAKIIGLETSCSTLGSEEQNGNTDLETKGPLYGAKVVCAEVPGAEPRENPIGSRDCGLYRLQGTRILRPSGTADLEPHEAELDVHACLTRARDRPRRRSQANHQPQAQLMPQRNYQRDYQLELLALEAQGVHHMVEARRKSLEDDQRLRLSQEAVRAGMVQE